MPKNDETNSINFTSSDVDWTQSNILNTFKTILGTKLSRSWQLTIPTEQVFTDYKTDSVVVFNLTDSDDRARLLQAYPTTNLTTLNLNQALTHSFVIAPNHGIYALQHAATDMKKSYLIWKKLLDKQQAYSRVKYAINESGDLFVYKTTNRGQNNINAYIAGIAPAKPLFRNYLRAKDDATAQPYHRSRVEWLYYLGEDLHKSLLINDRFNKTQIINIISQCLTQLMGIHDGSRLSYYSVFRDVKLTNFVIDKDNTVSLIDFDSAVPIDIEKGGAWNYAACTNAFAAPEIFDTTTEKYKNQLAFSYFFNNRKERWQLSTKEISCVYLTPAIDIYAFGKSIEQLIGMEHIAALFSMIELTKLNTLIDLMIDTNPQKRLTAVSLRMLLQHFFSSNELIGERPQLTSGYFTAHAIVQPLFDIDFVKDLPNLTLMIESCKTRAENQWALRYNRKATQALLAKSSPASTVPTILHSPESKQKGPANQAGSPLGSTARSPLKDISNMHINDSPAFKKLKTLDGSIKTRSTIRYETRSQMM